MSARDESSVRTLLDRAFVAMRTIGSHGPQHPLSMQAAEALDQAIEGAAPPFSLQFVSDGVFCDRALVPLDLEAYLQSRVLARALANLHVQELAFDAPLGVPGALALGAAIAKGNAGPSDDLEDDPIDGLRVRDLDHARLGLDAVNVDPEVAALSQAALAASAAEGLGATEGGWPWPTGLAVVRRLERASGAHANATAYAIELAPDGWTIGRRATSAAHLALTMLLAAGAATTTARATAHATLALATHGYRARGGLEIGDAANATLVRFVAAPSRSRSGVEPHRLQTTALAQAIASCRGPLSDAHPALGAVEVAYELEKRRCPEGIAFDLGRVDLLAHATRSMGVGLDERWVKVLVSALGVMPPGAWVRLRTGEPARVLGPGEADDPFRPEVVCRGRRFVPDARVTLVPPESRPLPPAA